MKEMSLMEAQGKESYINEQVRVKVGRRNPDVLFITN